MRVCHALPSPSLPPRPTYAAIVPNYFRGVEESIDANFNQPIQAGGRWLGTVFSDPVEGARQAGVFFRDFARGIDAAARANPAEIVNAITGAYEREYALHGLEGALNLGAYHAGYGTPLVAGGPYGEARAGLSAEEMIWALRPRRAASLTDDLRVVAGTEFRAPASQYFVMMADDLPSLGAADDLPQVTRNRLAGEAWEAEAIQNVLPQTQTNIQAQITIRSNGPPGLRVRLDAVGADIATGAAILSDMKGSATAPLTPNQTIVYPELVTHGGVVGGAGKTPYVGGTPIPPTQVTIIRKP